MACLESFFRLIIWVLFSLLFFPWAGCEHHNLFEIWISFPWRDEKKVIPWLINKVKHWLDLQIIFFRNFWAIGKPQQSWGSNPRSVSPICTIFRLKLNTSLFLNSSGFSCVFVSACGKCHLLLFKFLKEELNKKLSQLNYNLIKYLGSTNFLRNRTCRKRKMWGLWHFVASWGSPGVWALLWLINFRHTYPCIIGMQWLQPWM